MNAADAIYAGFADGYIPEAEWSGVKAKLVRGDIDALTYQSAPEGKLLALKHEIDRHFSHTTLAEVERSLAVGTSEFAVRTLKALRRNAPLAMGCCMQIVRYLRDASSIRPALDMEYRFTHRAVAQGDFIEGIRAAIIDKDLAPKWAHAVIADLTEQDVDDMLSPLGADALKWEDTI